MHIPLLEWRRIILMSGLALALATPVRAQDKSARCVAVHGALLQEKKGGWDSIVAGTDVSKDRLLVALFGAEFVSANGAVGARMLADVGQRGPFPVLEAALQFHASDKADLEVTLDRGILGLVNNKKSGAAHVILHVDDEVFDITLPDAKCKLGIEIYGRHVPGPPKLNAVSADAPVLTAAFFALEGEAVISNTQHATRLSAPPGPALYLWDNLTRTPDVHRFDKLPESVKPLSADEKKKFEKIAGFARTWAAKPEAIGKSLDQSIHSSDAGERKSAVVALGALDELPRLMDVLNDKAHADARDMAILVLRHWLGRAPGQSIRLHQHLTKKQGYTPTQAKNFIYLLRGIEKEKLRQPETFDLLIQALNHSKMPARELARWHLVRLVPEGRTIAYDAAADEPARERAIAEWRRLIPEGELPAPPKNKKP